jgi:hypothetical protein
MAERVAEDGLHPAPNPPPSPRIYRYCGLFDHNHRRNVFVLIGVLATLVLSLLVATIYLGVELGKQNRSGQSVPTASPLPGQEPLGNSPLENTAVTIIPALDVKDRQLIYQGKDLKLKFKTWMAATDAWTSYSYNLASNLSPRNGTPITGLTSKDMDERKIFFINDKNVLSDAFFDTTEGKWKLGTLAESKNFRPAAESKLTAIMWDIGGMNTQWVYWQAGLLFHSIRLYQGLSLI